MRHESHWWSIELPQGWIVEPNDDCTSIYKRDAVGVLQISAYMKDQAITNEELLEFIENEEVEPIQVAAFTGFTSFSSIEGQYWRKWWLADGPLMTFLTYNSDHADRHTETQEVDQMIGTLRSKV